MIVSLIGFMGSGKSTTGRELASLLGCRFVDLDRYIEDKKGESIQEIFDSEGELAFRAIEAEAVRDIVIMHNLNGEDTVLALGGGTLMTAPIRQLLFSQSICVYLKASAELLLHRIREGHPRPLAALDDKELLGRLEARTPVYSQAPVTVETDGKTTEQIADEIRQKLIEYEEPRYE